MREIREETGLVVRPCELLGIFPDAYGESDAGVYTLNLYYLVDIVSGEPRPADDVAELRWFSPEALPEMAFAHQAQVLARWREAIANEGNMAPQRKPRVRSFTASLSEGGIQPQMSS